MIRSPINHMPCQLDTIRHWHLYKKLWLFKCQCQEGIIVKKYEAPASQLCRFSVEIISGEDSDISNKLHPHHTNIRSYGYSSAEDRVYLSKI